MEGENNVKVAVRIRPQVAKEVIDMCNVCTTVTANEPQIWLGKDKAFTYDTVFDINSSQSDIYENCVDQLVEGCFDGYNATVLAYGQTGSGKTYTMGTGFDVKGNPCERGIIPRAFDHLFRSIKKRQSEAIEQGVPPPEFKVNAQFLELYNEDIIDLLADERTRPSQIKIHEDSDGGIYTVGATTRAVTYKEDAMQCLKMGALSRTTASTQMNSQSSRSHAIFTLHIKQQRIVAVDCRMNGDDENGDDPLVRSEFETLTAKFHFVDLAGSERLKRTGATGERAREGISINSGLLALGNVISALGDKSKRATHVPYRDSKVTRLLQDSLGGNSRTLMIACISPSDRDFMETLNTLRYANRAKNIKNLVVANQDKSSQTIVLLRQQIQQLQLELMEYKQGKRLINEDGSESVNDMYHENTMLLSEIANLKTRIKAIQDTNERLVARNAEILLEKEAGKWIQSGGEKSDITEFVQGYLREIEELRSKLIEAEETCTQIRKQAKKQQMSRLSLSPYSQMAVAISGHYEVGPDIEESTEAVIHEAKREICRMKRLSKTWSNKSQKEEGQDTNGNEVTEDNISLNGDDGDDAENDMDKCSTSDDSDDNEDDIATNEFELAELTNEISVKEKLILELEKSQKKMNTMKHQYEDKLIQLQGKINEIETERDTVLAKLSATGNQSNDQVKKVKADYEKKLSSLQTEVKKLQVAKREHAQAMKNQTQYEVKMRQVKNEVLEMKRQKVRLVNRMKEDTQKHREIELHNTKKIAQLSKQDRIKDVKIRNLETETKKYKVMLKRREDEVNVLKKQKIKPLSDRVAGRVTKSSPLNAKNQRNKSLLFSPKDAKLKWQKLEQNINKLVLNKQTIASHESQMERLIQRRGQLANKLEKTSKKYEAAVKRNDNNAISDLHEEMDEIEVNINYIAQSLNECQSTIMQIEEAKEETESLDMDELLNSLSHNETTYLFQKIIAMATSQSMLASQKEEERREYELKYKQVIDSSMVQEQLLHHVLDTTYLDMPECNEIDNLMDDNRPDTLSLEKHSVLSIPPVHDNGTRHAKARRMTKTHNELLYETSFNAGLHPANDDPMTQSLLNPSCLLTSRSNDIHRAPSAPSLKDGVNNKLSLKPDASPSMRRKLFDGKAAVESRRLNRNVATNQPAAGQPSNLPQSYVSRQFSTELSDSTPPASPPTSRRNRDENVFSRLTNGTVTNITNCFDRGSIVPFTGKPLYDKHSLLICSHIAEGHSRPVLSVAATNDVLFSGSKDQMAKIWDLQTGQEIQSLTDHPDAVVVVRYNEYSRLAFTVSKSYIKVWDPRDNPARCIKTLNSSGLVTNSGPAASITAKGTELASGEHRILDIQSSPYGTTLFSTSSSIVRVWDLRMFHCVGKLNTGHQAGIICMAIEEAGVDNNLVITGSKDHYIKVFEVMEGIGGIHNPKMTLKPPHYDGIEALKIHGDYLFSASRDACIKKWDLPNQKLVQSLNQAHKDWIQSLAVVNQTNILVSGCRSGVIKLWSTDTCQQLGDIKAHTGGIHSIDTNSSLVFTGSADSTIGLWRLRSSSDPSPEYDG